MTGLIEWKDLRCAFDGRTIFENFSGTLGFGERVRVTGESGCGKTTFLSMVLGICGNRPLFGGACPSRR